MKHKLEQLKKLVLEGGFDEDSRREVEALERESQEILSAERLTETPVIKRIIEYLQSQAEACNTILLESRDSLDAERAIVFAKRDIIKDVLKLFTPPSSSLLEQRINDLLTVAKTQR